MLRGLVRPKDLDDILSVIGGSQFALKRSLGAFNLTLIGAGAIIGKGIFATQGPLLMAIRSRAGLVLAPQHDSATEAF